MKKKITLLHLLTICSLFFTASSISARSYTETNSFSEELNSIASTKSLLDVLVQTPPPGETYCAASSANVDNEYISRVQLNTIDNSSDAQTYSDFTHVSTDLALGGSYTITVTPTWTGAAFQEGYSVWIDFNGDGDFSEAGELVWSKTRSNDIVNSGTFVVPNDAALGETRMRVMMRFFNIPTTPCGSFSEGGEVEDYTLNFVNATDTETPSTPQFLTASTVGGSSLSLQWEESTDNIGVTSYDVYQDNNVIAETSSTTIALNGLSPETTYEYEVRARDASGNVSNRSTPLSVTTTADTEAPTTPSELEASNITESTFNLNWTSSVDDVDGTSVIYDIYINDTFNASVSGTSRLVNELASSTEHAIYIIARDAAGNMSPQSETITVLTLQETEPPTTPTSLSGTNITISSVFLQWEASTDNIGVVAYELFQDGVLISTLSETSIPIMGLTIGTTYEYGVRALDAAGNMSGIATINITTVADMEAPTAPTSLTASNITGSSVNLDWISSTDNIGVTAYEIYQDGNFLEAIAGIDYIAENLISGTQYSYSVIARDAAGNSSMSSNEITITTLDTEPPTVPTPLIGSNITDTSVFFAWNPSTDNIGVVGYDLFQDDVLVTTVTGTNTSISNLQPLTFYRFHVIAKDAAGNMSNRSNFFSFTTQAPPDTESPTAPSSLSASNITGTSLNLDWIAATDNVGVAFYDIYRDGDLVDTIEGIDYFATNLTQNTTYSYHVVARDTAGNISPNSNTVTVTTLDTEAPTIPMELIATNNPETGGIILSWQESTDNVGVFRYNIFQDDVFIGAVSGPSSVNINNGLTSNTTYSFYIQATDVAGNVSGDSNTVSITTGETDTEPPTTPTALMVTSVTNNTVSLSWEASTDNFGLSSYFVFRDTFLVAQIGPNTTSYTVEQLDHSTTYSFSVQARDTSSNNSEISDSVSATTNGTVNCNSGSTQGDDFISRVQLNTIDNSSGISSYTDFTSISTSLNKEETYTITITPTWQGFVSQYAYAVWIDYNGNNDLTDSGELVWSKEESIDTPNSGSFTIPANAISGQVKMRVSMKSGTIPTACESFTLGEVEDYTVNLMELDVEPPTAPTGLVAVTNPQTGGATLSWEAATDNIGIDRYEVFQDDVFLRSINDLTVNVSQLIANTTYAFYVRAVDEEGNVSDNSNTVSFTTGETDAEPPTAPTSLVVTDVTNSTVSLSWEPSTDNYGEIASYRINVNGTTLFVQPGIMTTFIVEGLDSETSYTFSVAARDPSGFTSENSNTVSATTLSATVDCDSSSLNANEEFISFVQLISEFNGGAVLNNSSGSQVYSDFTNISANVYEGETYTIQIAPTFTGNSFNEGYAVWIDYNGNNDFTDPGEQVIGIAPTQDPLVTGSFIIPAGTTPGTVKMRVSMKFNGIPTACEVFNFGEVEDYSVILNPIRETESPTAPTNLVASNITETSVNLSWNAATDNIGVVAYDVYIDDVFAGSVTGLSAIASPLIPNTSYSFYVRARDAAFNESPNSNTVTFFTLPDTDAPEAPSNLSASNITETSVDLNWTAATDNVGVVAYNIYQDGNFLTTVTGIDYVVPNLEEGITYSFHVEARDAAGNTSTDSNTVTITTLETVPPTAPTALTASNITDTTADLTWVAATDNIGVVAYDIYIDDVFLNSVSVLTTTITQLIPNTSYSFYVQARDASGNVSPNSNTVTIFTLPDTEAPTAPTGLTASNITETTIDLNWNASTDNIEVIAYNIYQDGNFLTTVTGIDYVVPNLEEGTTYSFHVEARDAAGNTSADSNTVTITTLETVPPTAPTALTASNIMDTTVDLTWIAATDNVGVVAYDIYIDDVFLNAVSELTANISQLTPNTQYSFYVQARDASGNVSTNSNTVTIFTAPDTEAPTPPLSLTASNITETSVNLDWIAATDNIGVIAYDIYQDGNFLTTVAGIAHLVTNLTQGTSYTYHIVARDAAGNTSENSNTVIVNTTDTEAPSTPTELTTSNATDSTVDLHWIASTDNVDVVGYDIFQDGNFLTSTTGIDFTVTNLVPDITYTFYVVARDAAGNSSLQSNTATITIQIPDSFIAGYFFETGFEGWTDGGDDCRRVNFGARSFEGNHSIRINNGSSSSNSFSPALDFTGNTTIYIEFHTYSNSMENGESFFVEFFNGTSYEIIENYVSGTDFNNGEFFSNVIELSAAEYNFTTDNRIRFRNNGDTSNDHIYFDQVIISGDDAIAPLAPTSLVANNITETTVDLSWNAATDNVNVVAYDIYQDGDFLTSTTDTNYTVTDLTGGTTYSYHVIARDAAGNNSPQSNTVTITTQASVNDGLIAGYFFETGFEGWTDGGEDCHRVNFGARSFEGNHSIRIRNGSTSSNSFSPALNLAGNTTIYIEFHTYSNSMENGESFFVEFFNGTSYEIIGTYVRGVDFNNGEFFSNVIELSAVEYNFTTDNRIRFRNNGDTSNDHIYFDQVIISGDDAIAPLAPTSLVANNITETTVDLSWNAATDNVNVVGYDIYRDGSFLNTTTDTNYIVTELTGDTTYSYHVIARDAAGNNSPQSNTVTVTTQAPIIDGMIAGYFFETGFEGWTDGGDDCRRVNFGARSFEGQHSIRINNGSESSNSFSPALNFTGFNAVSIEFHTYSNSMENGESFFVEFFNGTSYEIIGTYVRGIDFNNGEFFTDTIVLDASEYTFITENRIRFSNNGNEFNDHIYFDQVIITGDISSPFRNQDNLLSISENKEQVTEFALFPNPVLDRIQVKIDGFEEEVTYTIVNMLGQQIDSGLLINNTIDAQTLPNGVYKIMITDGNRFNSLRFIKK